jgi:transposase-like protein
MIIQRRSSSSISETERREIIKEYLKGGRTKVDIWRQYTGNHEEHGQIARWMRRLCYAERIVPMRPLYLPSMPPTNKPQSSVEELQQKIKQLEKQLLDSQLKEEAYRRMIDIAVLKYG